MGLLKNISNILKYGFKLLVIALLIGSGIYVGRKSVKFPVPETVIEYIESEPIHDTLFKPKPYIVEKPTDTLDIIKKCIADGIYKELWPKEKEIVTITKEDTTAIMKDWVTKRFYNENLFNTDTLGKCTVNTEVQYNRIVKMDYEFIPSVKNIEHVVYTTKKWSPFVETGLMFGIGNEMPDKIGNIGVGTFYKDKVGLEVNYQRGFVSKNDYLGGSILLKF